MIDLLDRRVVSDYGSFKKVAYYFEGWIRPDAEGKIKGITVSGAKVNYTNGWRGKETHILKSEIYPIHTIEVI